jgi:hypothetical protein
MFKKQSKSPRFSAAKQGAWLWVKENSRESFFEITPQGHMAQATHQTLEPWIDAKHQHVISFNREEDLEIKAEPRESEVAMQKRIMADVGVKIVSWAQRLKSEDAQKGMSLDVVKRLGSHFLASDRRGALLNGQETSDKSSEPFVSGTWMYATSQERMKTIPAHTKVWSGIALVRHLLAQAFQRSSAPETPFVTGVVFSGEPTTVIVFLKCDVNGQFTLQQVVRLADLSEEAFESACTDFAEQARLGRGLPKDRIKLFDGAVLLELLSTAASTPLRPYPTEPEIFGMRQSTWLQVAMYASAGALAVDLVWGLSALGMTMAARSENQQLQQHLQSQVQLKKIDLDKRFLTLIKEGSVPVDGLIDQARQMYREGMRLEIDATRTQTTYRVSRRFADEASQPAAMADLLQITTSEGCSRNAPETTLQLNEVFVYVQCKTVDPYLARVLGSGA